MYSYVVQFCYGFFQLYFFTRYSMWLDAELINVAFFFLISLAATTFLPNYSNLGYDGCVHLVLSTRYLPLPL